MNINIEDTIIPSVYTDSEGNERTLRQMFNYEPEWFYSRFEHMQKALEQLQAEIEENNLIIRELIFCIDKKASKSHMQRTINKAMKISNTRGSIVL
jgi:hypothetical protein